MENTSYIALSRQAALWRQLDVIAGNMANVNTPGYKSEQMMFREYLMNTRSSDRATGTKLSYVQDSGILRDTRDGALARTDNPLDVALSGPGYFQVESEAGMRYTRGGHFQMDSTGMIVNDQGYALMDNNDNPIIIAPSEHKVEITSDGNVVTDNGVIAKLKVVSFSNDQELRKAGDGLYETTLDPQTVARPLVVQGMVEESNVQPVVELTKMTELLRQYQAAQKMLDNEHERQLKAIQTLVPSSNS